MTDFSKIIRRDALALLYHANSGHPGGALSCADIVAFLWEHELSYKYPDWQKPDRNRMVLSKGHSVAAIYAAAGRSGLLEPDQATSLRKLGSSLQGHPHVLDTPWVETSTGSLGQGFSVAVGMALGLRHQKISSRVYVILGDGEMQEGEVWEAAMSAAHFRLDKLCVIIDYNKMQSDDLNENIMRLEPLVDKWRSFNWAVQEIDGHDMEAIRSAVDNAKKVQGQPSVIIAHTLKGKGVSFMEGVPEWHGSVKITSEQLKHALKDLGANQEQIEDYLNGTFWR
ncbi:transketolase [Methylobacter sp. G7]|uniref:transketolase n=1 Tax=Methylobacter sp. G7 TaxID=3230117 RepID=UPI003D805E50